MYIFSLKYTSMFFKSGSLRDCLHFNFLYLVIINGLYDNTANIKKYRFLFTFAEYETASVESEAFYFPTPP